MELEHFLNSVACFIMFVGIIALALLLFMSICEGMFGTALLSLFALLGLSIIAYSSDSFSKLEYNSKNDRYKRYVEEFGAIQTNTQESEHFQHLCSCCVCGTKTKKEELDNE